jgi:hypothetical protein
MRIKIYEIKQMNIWRFMETRTKKLKVCDVQQDLRGCPSQVKGDGFRSRWRRPAWVQIPPPAPGVDILYYILLYHV